MDCFSPSPSSSDPTKQQQQHLSRQQHPQQPKPTYRCPYCRMEGLTEDGLHAHFPLYHVAEPNVAVVWSVRGRGLGLLIDWFIH